MTTCKIPVYLITDQEDLVTRFTLSKLFFDEHNRGRMRSNVHLAPTLESAMIHAKKNYSSWILCVTPGHVFMGNFWHDFENLITNDLDIGIIGHVMHNRFEPLLHQQALAINLKAFDHLDQSDNIVLDPDLNSRGYAKEILLKKDFFENFLCKHALENHYRVINWPDSLRNNKVNWYKKELDDLVNQLTTLCVDQDQEDHRKKIILSSVIGPQIRNKKILWIANNKTPNVLDFDHILCPASGLFWLEAKANKVTVFDYNSTQLNFAEDLWRDKPANLSHWIRQWIQKHDCLPNFIHSDQLDQFDEYMTNKKFCYDKQVDFLHLDIFEDYQHLKQCRGATIWLSNIGLYEPNILQHGIQKFNEIKSWLSNHGIAIIEDHMGRHHGWI